MVQHHQQCRHCSIPLRNGVDDSAAHSPSGHRQVQPTGECGGKKIMN